MARWTAAIAAMFGVCPSAADGPVVVRIDVSKVVGPISPFIYGSNDQDPTHWDARPCRYTLGRIGGNRWTAYNWVNNASNAGNDWQHQNDDYLKGGNRPGMAVGLRAGMMRQANAGVVVTVPMIGRVAADKAADGDVNKTADYLHRRFRQSLAKKNASFSYPPDASDPFVYQDEFVAWLETTFSNPGGAKAKALLYSLDNEPDLWHDTHARIQERPTTYGEIAMRTIDYARAIKAVAPKALVLGGALSGWSGIERLGKAPDAGKRHFTEFLLDTLKREHDRTGQRLVDVLDVHWYPEHRGANVRITADDATPEVAAARVQAPRSLWDPAFHETSWISRKIREPIRLIPRLQAMIEKHYPGTRLSIGEYYFGGGADISGGLAQADALGIFGREKVFAACLFHEGKTDDRYIHAAFDLYRNYDGDGGRFGDASVEAKSSDVAILSAHAALNSQDPNRATVIVVNRQTSEVEASFEIADGAFRPTERYQLTSAAPQVERSSAPTKATTSGFSASLPARSATLFILAR